MVVVYRCKSCGYILFVFERVGQSSYGLPTPSELADMLGYHCPRCGRRLQLPSLEDVHAVAGRALVEARIKLLRDLLAEQRRPRLLHVVKPTREVAVHG